jgi:peptidoglycan/xylan/chitin deacetylase (PgdA/CDA1 family)
VKVLDRLARGFVREAQRWIPDTGAGQVLCYHLVGAGIGSPVDLPLPVFEAQLAELAARGDVRPLREVVESGRGVAVTFDDAFLNFAQQAWPRLRQAKLPVTLYVPTGFIDGTHGSPLPMAPHLPPCTWAQLQEMHAEGLEIGSHSAAHADMRNMSFAEADRDIAGAKGRLEQMLEPGVAESFCFPRALVGRNVMRAALDHHRLAVRGGGLSVGITRGPVVRRISVRAGGHPMGQLLGRIVDLEELLADGVRQARGR